MEERIVALEKKVKQHQEALEVLHDFVEHHLETHDTIIQLFKNIKNAIEE